MVMLSEQPERRKPLPSFWAVPGHLLGGLSRGGRRLAVGAFLGLIAVVAVFGLAVVPDLRADRESRAAGEARRAAAERSALIAELDRQAQARVGTGPATAGVADGRLVARRRSLLVTLEDDVRADAQARADRGELRGTYRSARCFEFPKRLTDRTPEQLTNRPVLRMECIAVASRVRPSERSTGSLIGQPFRARIDFERGRYAWCKIVQRPGELSIQQALVRVPRACRG